MSRYSRKAPVLIAFALAACNVQGVSEPEPSEPMPKVKDSMRKPKAEVDTTLQPLIDQAEADLVKQKQVDATDVVVVQAERVTWRSGALGCPMPDRGYTMVLTPGVLIRLRAGGTIYEYHSTLRGPPFLCEPPGRIETPAPSAYSQDPT